jgi:hypothetical protein
MLQEEAEDGTLARWDTSHAKCVRFAVLGGIRGDTVRRLARSHGDGLAGSVRIPAELGLLMR